MAFNPEQLSYGGKAAIDYYLKNDPVDQITQDKPFLKFLLANRSDWGGGLQYVVEQLRYSQDSNFQSYFGDQQVTYNRKRTLDQAKYTWGAWHDGFGLNEDELAQNGITMTDDKTATPTDSEKVQLTNLIQENTATLKLGFETGMDSMLHLDGSQSATDIPGLDHLIQTDPTVASVVGGIDQSTNTWWRNNKSLAIASTAGLLTSEMEKQWRACTQYGGFSPDFIICGAAFLDAYRVDAGLTINRQIFNGGNMKGGVTLDSSIAGKYAVNDSGLYFKGVPLIWDPTFENLDALYPSASPAWTKRCYFLNSKFIKLRPIKGHWMISRKPPRVYDRYVQYWGLTGKAALSVSKRNAMSVLSIA